MKCAAIQKTGPAMVYCDCQNGGDDMPEPQDIARKAVDIASNKQAADIVLLDVRGLCSFADYFVVCTAESERQIRAILEATREELKKDGVRPHHEEGGTDTGWMLLDYGDVVIHIFGPEERDYYDLDGLWHHAARVMTIQ